MLISVSKVPTKFSILGKAIRSMAEQMRKTDGRRSYRAGEQTKSEMDALQAQINPHFLYNTLDSIVWMVENEATKALFKW